MEETDRSFNTADIGKKVFVLVYLAHYLLPVIRFPEAQNTWM